MSGTTTLASTRENPWYSVGTQVEEAMSAEEALQLGGLDWDVEMRPAGYLGADGATFKTIAGKYAVVRTDNDAWQGQVGSQYKVFQNREAFAFADNLVDGGLKFDSVGSYQKGKKIFLVAGLPETVQLFGEDAYKHYLFLTTSHDGTSSIKAVVTSMRAACTNMFPAITRTAKSRWAIRHTSSAAGRVAEARQSLALTFKAIDGFEAEMEELVRLTISEAEVEAVMAKVLPKTPKVEEKVAAIVGLFKGSPNLEPYRGTRYAALQAFGEFVDWGRDVRTPEARFNVSFEGYGARQRAELHRMLLPA